MWSTNEEQDQAEFGTLKENQAGRWFDEHQLNCVLQSSLFPLYSDRFKLRDLESIFESFDSHDVIQMRADPPVMWYQMAMEPTIQVVS